MASLIEILVEKMGLNEEESVLEKSRELVRLLELRESNFALQLSGSAKIVICIDLAATALSIAFDKEQALLLAGLRKPMYVNQKRMVEKLLDLTKVVGIDEICVKLSLNGIAKKAKEILELYRSSEGHDQRETEAARPQDAAMAVFQACKLLTQRAPKTKLLPFSQLRPTQWHLLEQRWNLFVEKHSAEIVDNKDKKALKRDAEKMEKTDCSSVHVGDTENLKSKKAETEDYEVWKKRMLAIAELQIKQQTVTKV